MADEQVERDKVSEKEKKIPPAAESLIKGSQEIDGEFAQNDEFLSRREAWVDLLNDLRRAEEQGIITRDESIFVQATYFARDSILAERDPLTDLPNRRGLLIDFIRTAAHLKRTEEPLTVVLVDLDNLKRINTNSGYEGGDRALQILAELVKTHLREEDLIGRWGGDEYAIILSGQTRSEALTAMKRMKESISSSEPGLKFSVGIAQEKREYDLSELINLANVALGLAKEQGKDKLVVWEEGMPRKVEKK